LRPINLLPPEVSEEKSRRRRLALGILAGVAYVGVLGLGVIWWNGKIDDARTDLDAQLDITRSLEREIVILGDSGALQTEFDSKAILVEAALFNDIDWGGVLTDLSRLIPPRVWVETFSGTIVPITTPGVVGQVTFSGVGLDFPDVSDWLRSLDSEQFVGLGGTWVSTISQGAVGETGVVTFSSTAILTPGATSDRANSLVPEVP